MTYIKRLVMHGFKSFPKKTEVPFTQGINVVLGPNGSGKSNVSDAICFVLGRLSIKSMRAAKAQNLIFMGSKSFGREKEASVELILDNQKKVFSIPEKEVSIKRIVRKNGQGIYKINNKTKTRQEVLNLLAQAGIDPKGFNIVLQGEIQNFVQIHPEERRGVIEEVSGISIYESRKQKSLKELEKTDERLKEISSILKERTIYLNNLEKERRQALRYKKIQKNIQNTKASIINQDLKEKEKELNKTEKDVSKKLVEKEKIRDSIVKIETEIKSIESEIASINSKIQEETGLQQEKLNSEIADLRAELAGFKVKHENYESKILEISKEKSQTKESMKELKKTLDELKKDSPENPESKIKEIQKKKQELENLEKKRKKFYMVKSEIKPISELINSKVESFQGFTTESDFLLKQIERISMEIFDKKSDKEKLKNLNIALSQKRETLKRLLSQESNLEKTNSINEREIENQKKILDKVSKLDVCPICKSKVTPGHLKEIESEITPIMESLKKQIQDNDKELKEIYRKKEILEKDLEQIHESISKTEEDIRKLDLIEDKKSEIKFLQEKIENLGTEIKSLKTKKESLESELENLSGIEKKYETLKIEIEDISFRSKDTYDSEISFKEREIERQKISLREFSRNESDLKDELNEINKILQEKEKLFLDKKKQEEKLSEKYRALISERNTLQSEMRNKEFKIPEKESYLQSVENQINELKIEKARLNAGIESLKTELLQFKNPEIIKSSREKLSQKLTKLKNIFENIGTVNFRSLEVYDSIKKEYDSIKEKSDQIVEEKENVLKVIKEIDTKKKKAFLDTLKKVNGLFSRNFSQLSTKGQVFLELENKKNPFEGGLNVVVKTGHGKYFDVKSLSGGEQTLVALSLIFAIQEYRPYYFYLLDEVDAALDKRNSQRLASLLTKYMQKGQYIVISHNDEVINNATNLYGVSMHDGVSKIISLKV